MPRFSRASLPIAFTLLVFGGTALVACGGQNPYQAAKNSVPASTAGATDTQGTANLGDNGFIPDRNLSDCVGTMERPNCGSAEKGTMGTYLTFGVLILGLGFIFWRISIGVRQRDAVMNAPADPSTTRPDATHTPKSD